MLIPPEMMGITPNIGKVRKEIEDYFISGVTLPSKRVKNILNKLYQHYGFVRKAKSTDLTKLWGMRTQVILIRDRRTKKVIQFTRVI